MNKTKRTNVILFFVCLAMILGCTGCQSKEGKPLASSFQESGLSDISELVKAVIEESQQSLNDTIIIEKEEEEPTYISSLEDEFSDVPEVFREVLRQYLQIPIGTNLYEETYWEKLTQGEWKDVYRYLGGKDRICYSLHDLTGDGFPELIMGKYANADEGYPWSQQEIFQVQGASWKNSYGWIYVIYYYNGKEVKNVCECEGNHIELYENGIIHYSGGGIYLPMEYLQFQADTGDYETGAYTQLKMDHGEVIGFLKDTEDGMVEITEEEYNQIKAQYTTSPVELEWIAL